MPIFKHSCVSIDWSIAVLFTHLHYFFFFRFYLLKHIQLSGSDSSFKCCCLACITLFHLHLWTFFCLNLFQPNCLAILLFLIPFMAANIQKFMVQTKKITRMLFFISYLFQFWNRQLNSYQNSAKRISIQKNLI